jgi:hypothetical protein
MPVRRIYLLIALGFCAMLLPGCETTVTNAPPITAPLIRAGVRQQADARVLAEGRSTLLNSCIQCHAVPDVAKFSPDRLRRIVAIMSDRAHLGPEEEEALAKYLLTVRSLGR